MKNIRLDNIRVCILFILGSIVFNACFFIINFREVLKNTQKLDNHNKNYFHKCRHYFNVVK